MSGLALTAAFLRESQKQTCFPVFLVNIAGVQKFVQAKRAVLGYANNILSVTSRSQGIDPIKCTQTLGVCTIEFLDDNLVRSLVTSNNVPGKTVSVKLGFDTGDDTTFLETDYADYCTGILSKVRSVPGKIIVELRDARAAIFFQNGAAIQVPQYGDVVLNGEPPSFEHTGSYPNALLRLLQAGGISTDFYDATTYTAASASQSGHLGIFRVGFNKLVKPAPLADLLDEIACVARAYNLLREDGKMILKEFDAAAVPSVRFTAKDIIPESVEVEFGDIANIINSFVGKCCYSGDDSTEKDFMMTVRDEDSSGMSSWSWQDTTNRQADFSFESKWFGTPTTTKNQVAVAAGDTSIDVAYGVSFSGAQGAATSNPKAVDASHPGYIWIKGVTGSGLPANGGELIKYTSITRIGSTNHYTLGGLTRSVFGVGSGVSGTGIAHATTTSGPGPMIREVTALVYMAQGILDRYPAGLAKIKFKTPLHMYATQLADPVYIENDVFLRTGLSTLAVGNTTVFEMTQKEVDIKSCQITWQALEIRSVSHTPAPVTGAKPWPPIRGLGNTGSSGSTKPNPFGSSGFLFNGADNVGALTKSFLDGDVPSTSANLTTSIPYQAAATRDGITIIPEESHTFTASKDTYLDLCPYPHGQSVWTYQEVANGAGAPSVATGESRAFKVVTNGTAITAVTDLRNTQTVAAGNIADGSITNAKVNAAAGIVGTKLSPGAGALTNLDSSGKLDFSATHNNKILDNIADGSTYKRVASVNGSNQVTTPSIANDAVTVAKSIAWNNAITAIDSSGTTTISGGTTQLSTDGYYQDLVIRGTGVLQTRTNRIFVNGTLTLTGNARIHSDGAVGTSATVQAGAVQSSQSGFMLCNGATGGNGGAGGTSSTGSCTAGSNGNAGTGTTGFGLGGAGGRGNNGVASTCAAGSGVAGGTAASSNRACKNVFDAVQGFDIGNGNSFTGFKIQAGSGGGGGGGGGGQNLAKGSGFGGGGGAGGNGGDALVIVARHIVTTGADGNWTGSISANGGNGGNGAAASTGGGQGGGGGGGGGGWVAVIYGDQDNVVALQAGVNVTANGGSVGSGGASGGGGNNGTVRLIGP